MFKSNFISISDNSVYYKYYSFYFPILPIYLLNIYLKEADDFAYKICLNSSLGNFLFKSFCLERELLGRDKLGNYIPLKLDYFITRLFKTRSIISERYNFLIKRYTRGKSLGNFFNRNVSFVRYLDFFLFGFLTSLTYTRRFYRKYLCFVRSNLHFDVKESKILLLKDDLVYFLGFQVKLRKVFDKRYFTVFSTKKNETFTKKMILRFAFYKRKSTKILFNRINFELLSYLNGVVNSKIISQIFTKRKIWMYIFQQEAIRSSRMGKVFSNSNQTMLLSKPFLLELKKFYFTNQFIYYFDSYILKMQLLISDIVRDFEYSLDSQLISFDVSIENFLKEYRKYLYFFYNEIYFKRPYQPVRIDL